MTRARKSRSAKLLRRGSEKHGGYKVLPATNSAHGGSKCCACHEICASRFTKCCACHEICTSRFTKCCTCHEICRWRSTKCCACHEICIWRFTKCYTCHEMCTWRFTRCCACHETCTWKFTKCLELLKLEPTGARAFESFGLNSCRPGRISAFSRFALLYFPLVEGRCIKTQVFIVVLYGLSL